MTTVKSPFSGICSYPFGTIVSLKKWWLIESDSTNNALGVGGFAFTKGQGIRIFHSAAISKRHDTNLIDTVDGITVHLVGFLDEARTCENGFTSKVYDFFRFGFPYNWEEYIKDDTNLISNKNRLPSSFDDIPISQVRDLLRYPVNDRTEYEEISKILFNDILLKCDDNTIHLTDNPKNLIPMDHKHNVGNCISIDEPQKNESSKQLTRDSRLGVATRSMRKKERETKDCFKSSIEHQACDTAKKQRRNSDSSGKLSDVSDQQAVFGHKESDTKNCLSGQKETEILKFSNSALRRSTRKKKSYKAGEVDVVVEATGLQPNIRSYTLHDNLIMQSRKNERGK